MNSFINIKKDFDPSLDFWDLNPHLTYTLPFSKVYPNSKFMWCVLWMNDPDEESNKFYRLPYEDRLDACKSFYEDFNSEDELFIECSEAYNTVCLTSIERALKQEKEALVKRAEFLRNTEYNLDTMTALDNAFSKTYNILKNYDKIEKEFLKQKEQDIRIYGNRRQTLRERKQLDFDV